MGSQENKYKSDEKPEKQVQVGWEARKTSISQMRREETSTNRIGSQKDKYYSDKKLEKQVPMG